LPKKRRLPADLRSEDYENPRRIASIFFATSEETRLRELAQKFQGALFVE